MAGQLTNDLDRHSLGRLGGRVGQIGSEPGETLHGALAGWELHHRGLQVWIPYGSVYIR